MIGRNYTKITRVSTLACSLAFLFANLVFAQNDSTNFIIGGGNNQNSTQSAIDSSESSESDSAQKDFSATKVYDLGRIERVVSGYNVYGDAGTNATVTTITAQDIANIGAQNIGEALRFTPGIFYAPGYGSRNEVTLYMRGHTTQSNSASYVGVYLDGIPIDAVYQQTAWNHINMNGISAIDISKGYTSLIYGMKSLGGAINMITQKPIDKIETKIKYTFIEGDEHQANVYIGSNIGQWYFSADYGYITRNSLPLSRSFRQNVAQNTSKMRNAYYDDHTFRAKVGFEPNENHEYSVNLTLQRGKRGGVMGTTSTSTSAPWNWPHYDNTLVYLVGRSNILDNLVFHSRVFYHGYYNQLISPTWGNSVYDDFRVGGIFHFDYNITENMNLQVGVNIKDESHKRFDLSSDRIGAVSRKNLPKTMDYNEIYTSIFAQYSWRFIEQLRFSVSGSYDNEAMIYVKTSPNNVLQNISKGKPIHGWNLQGILYYDINKYTTMHFNIGRKTSMPKAFSRYSSSRGSYIVANPNLGPEAAINYEIGASFDYEGTSLNGTVFLQHLNDMIASVNVSPDQCGNPLGSGNNTYCQKQVNVDEGFNYGVEIGFKQSFLQDMISFGANYSYLNAKTKKDSNNYGINGSRILNYPTHLFNANIIYKPADNVDLILYATYQGKRWTTARNSQTEPYYYAQYPSVFLMDLKVNFRPIESLQLSIGAYNLLDRNYYYGSSYYMAGRRIYASLEYKY